MTPPPSCYLMPTARICACTHSIFPTVGDSLKKAARFQLKGVCLGGLFRQANLLS